MAHATQCSRPFPAESIKVTGVAFNGGAKARCKGIRRWLRAYLDFFNSGAASLRQQARRPGSYSRFSHARMPRNSAAHLGKPMSPFHHGCAWRLVRPGLAGQKWSGDGVCTAAKGLRCETKDRLGPCCSSRTVQFNTRVATEGGGGFDWPGGGGRWCFSVMAWEKRTRMPSGLEMGKRRLDAAKARW